MSAKRYRSWIVLGLAFALLLAGLSKVYEYYVSGGEGINRGSTLKAGGTGTMIFYESLTRMPHLTVLRNADTYEKLAEKITPQTTQLWLINMPDYWWVEPNTFDREFIESGGRLIVSFKQENEIDDEEEDEEDEENLHNTSVWEAEKSIATELGLELPQLKKPLYPDFLELDTGIATFLRSQNDPSAPTEIPWPVSQVFVQHENDQTGLEVLYTVENRPVVMQKKIGRGAVIFLADSVLLENQSMYTNRQTAWLHWIMGDAQTHVFEERYFGLTQPRGLAALIWEYRLQGFVAALCIPFCLLLWHGSISLLPPLSPEEEALPHLQSRLSGFRDVLKRHVSEKDILPESVRQWEASFLKHPTEKARFSKQSKLAAELLVTHRKGKSSGLADRYLQLHDIFTQKRTKR